ATPDSGGAVEIEKTACAITSGLLNNEVAIEHDGLESCQKIVSAVDVRPAHLSAAHHRIGKVINQLTQTIRLRHKVSIEDRQEFTFGNLQTCLKGTGFETGPVTAMDIGDIKSLIRILPDSRFGELHSLVG